MGGAAAGIVVLATTTSSGLAPFTCELIGIGFGATLGLLVALERAGTHSDAWAETFEDSTLNHVWVGEYTPNAHERARARHILETHHANQLVVADRT
jgi:hypothetical protein